MACLGGQRRGYERKYFGREFQRRPGRSNGVWKPTVPAWEKEYCKSVGLPWHRVCWAKDNMDVCMPESVQRWDDSAGKEAFENAKRKYWADRNGVPCDVPPANPDLYIDKIDWESAELGNFEGLDIPEAESESDKEDGLSYNYGYQGYNKENIVGYVGADAWKDENMDPITKYISSLNGVKFPRSGMGWSDREDGGVAKKESDDRGWGVLETRDVNFTGWDYKNEAERKTNAHENCLGHENAMRATPGWGNYPARTSKGQAFHGRNGWRKEVGGDSRKDRYPSGHYKSAIKKQYSPNGRSKQPHCSVYPPCQKDPFAQRHWNAVPQTSQWRMNRPARRNSGARALHNVNWGNVSKGFNQAGHWRSRPEYKQGSCAVSKHQNVQYKGRDPSQGDFPARTSFTPRIQT